MSVVKSQREEGKLAVITKAGELATYTIHIERMARYYEDLWSIYENTKY